MTAVLESIQRDKPQSQSLPIYDSLVEIRSRLESIHENKSTYVKTHDVLTIFSDLITQFRNLAADVEDPSTSTEADSLDNGR